MCVRTRVKCERAVLYHPEVCSRAAGLVRTRRSTFLMSACVLIMVVRWCCGQPICFVFRSYKVCVGTRVECARAVLYQPKVCNGTV